MKTGDAFYPLFAAAPPGQWKLERLQALDSREGQHAKAEEANPAFGRLSSGDRLPQAAFLLIEIGGHFPVERQHAEGDVLLHHAYDAILDHAHHLHMAWHHVLLELVDACSDGKQNFEIAVA
jgi:hypothetical protein